MLNREHDGGILESHGLVYIKQTAAVERLLSWDANGYRLYPMLCVGQRQSLTVMKRPNALVWEKQFTAKKIIVRVGLACMCINGCVNYESL